MHETMTGHPQISAERKYALAVLAHGAATGRTVYDDQRTSRLNADRLTISWDVLGWLVAKGFADFAELPLGSRPLELTAIGKTLALTLAEEDM